MKGGTRVALGVAVGYFLGRTRKMKVALMLAGAGATGRLPSNSRDLVREGIKRLGDSAEVGKLTESVRGELTDAAKRAAVAAASNRIDALTNRIEGVGSGVGEGVGKVGEDVGDTVGKIGEGLLGGKESQGDEKEAAPEADEDTEVSESDASTDERPPAPRQRKKRTDSDDTAGDDEQEEPRRRAAAPRTSTSRRSTPRTRKDSEPKSRTRTRSTASADAPVRRTGR
ncbi:hypothetical protein [Rhodococcus sp. (in: high G+C Gram-positive bacteria)]|uniref:hypothetical protein n=1 Tax=Rhodococcus sp. TaxID=1831 RepID=UPI003B8A8B6F